MQHGHDTSPQRGLELLVFKTTPSAATAHVPFMQQSSYSPGWCTFNTEGAVCNPSSLGSTGGLVHDHGGEWLVGFNKNVGISSPLQVELWGIHAGLKLAWSYGFERLQCQTDCSEAFNLVTCPSAHSSPMALVRAIARHIRCEANFATDYLAKLPTNSDGFICIFSASHTATPILSRDLHGPTYVSL